MYIYRTHTFVTAKSDNKLRRFLNALTFADAELERSEARIPCYIARSVLAVARRGYLRFSPWSCSRGSGEARWGTSGPGSPSRRWLLPGLPKDRIKRTVFTATNHRLPIPTAPFWQAGKVGEKKEELLSRSFQSKRRSVSAWRIQRYAH